MLTLQLKLYRELGRYYTRHYNFYISWIHRPQSRRAPRVLHRLTSNKYPLTWYLGRFLDKYVIFVICWYKARPLGVIRKQKLTEANNLRIENSIHTLTLPPLFLALGMSSI